MEIPRVPPMVLLAPASIEVRGQHLAFDRGARVTRPDLIAALQAAGVPMVSREEFAALDLISQAVALDLAYPEIPAPEPAAYAFSGPSTISDPPRARRRRPPAEAIEADQPGQE